MKQLSRPRRRIGWGLLLLRFLVGWVFLSEGIQKFLFPAALGEGDCTRLDSVAQFTGPFVGATETVCGSLLILGLFSSLAVWPLLIHIRVAIAVEVGKENGPPKRGPVTTALSKTLLEQSW
jgi:putative oxidoreductase